MAGRREVPVDPGAGPVQRFAFELRKLRTEAGGLTYRVLAQRAGYGVTTLSQAAAGEQLPTLPVVLAYVKACGGDPAEWEVRWRQAVDEAASNSEDDEEGGRPPYRGLARFQPGDSGLFFGREKLTSDVLELVGRRRFAGVFGASGSGKSSLLRSGLIPALRHTQDVALRPAGIRILTPGQHPARTHAQALDIRPGRDSTQADVFVIVDQFEEVFTLCHDPTERAAFIDLLLTARQPASRLRVLLAVRADFYGRCAEHPGLSAALRDANLLVGPMSRAELRAAIVKPAAAAGLTVERALTARLVDEVADAPGGLPLLSHVLLETWRRRRGKTMTLAGYQAAGGLEGAVAKTAEDIYGQFTEAQAAAARRLLLRLVAPGEGTPDTRRPADLEELRSAGSCEPETDQVLEAIARARLLALDGGTVDLAHEALLTAWPRLRGWIAEDREFLRHHRKLTEAAHAWEELGRDPAALYRGNRLATAEEHFSQDPAEDLTALEHEFLTASTTARDQEARSAARTTRRLRTLNTALSALLVLALTAGLVAWQQSRTSDQQRQAADSARRTALSRQLAAQSAALITTNSDLASLLAIQAYRTSPTTQAAESLYAAAAVPLRHRLTGHPYSVVTVAFSPDGRALASSDNGGTMRLWDTATGRLRRNQPEGGAAAVAFAVAFTPDGRTMAIASPDGVELRDTTDGRTTKRLDKPTVDSSPMAFSPDGRTLIISSVGQKTELWDTATGRIRARLAEQSNDVCSLAFATDGRTLATGGFDGGVELWDAATGRLRRSLPRHTAPVASMAFSPDGRALATSSDGGVKLWDPEAGSLRESLVGYTAPISMAFSPDGRTLATGSTDNTVRLWETDTGQLPRGLPGHTGPVLSLAFSPDGSTLATGAGDRTVRLWDVMADQSRPLLSNPRKEIASVAFSPDGRTMATGGSSDQAVQLWDMTTGRLRTGLPGSDGDTGPSLAFSPDGRTLATSSDTRGVELWDVATARHRRSLAGYTADAGKLAFSPDGRTLATGSATRGVELWDVATGRNRSRSRSAGYHGTVFSLVFGPDGRTLAVTGENGAVLLRDTIKNEPQITLAGHTGAVLSMAFSPDGRTLATGGEDHTVRLWDTATGRSRSSLTGHTAPTTALAFSPDGRTLATGSKDNTVRLWDVATGITRVTLAGHTEPVLSVAFAPDGHTLATGSTDQTVRQWDADRSTPTTAINEICRTIGRNITAQERSMYLPEQPPPATCPK
ncbi:nSTAND1 domain-containing NTPase [Streptomyces acidicola]|uniref:nSTAND1 domain-containing NTPase n=1 Tax=Streptomyces acidicola TaxID=2596892 RepID=UPI00381DD0B6